jgi:predicted metal-binding protein
MLYCSSESNKTIHPKKMSQEYFSLEIMDRSERNYPRHYVGIFDKVHVDEYINMHKNGIDRCQEFIVYPVVFNVPSAGSICRNCQCQFCKDCRDQNTPTSTSTLDMRKLIDRKMETTGIAIKDPNFYVGLVNGLMEFRCIDPHEHKIPISAVVNAFKSHFTKDEIAKLF